MRADRRGARCAVLEARRATCGTRGAGDAARARGGARGRWTSEVAAAVRAAPTLTLNLAMYKISTRLNECISSLFTRGVGAGDVTALAATARGARAVRPAQEAQEAQGVMKAQGARGTQRARVARQAPPARLARATRSTPLSRRDQGARVSRSAARRSTGAPTSCRAAS